MKEKYCYAEEFFEGKERDFLERYLHDLHDENYGWYRGAPVIFDYACNDLWEAQHSCPSSPRIPPTEEVSES